MPNHLSGSIDCVFSQFPNNAIVKGNYNFLLILNDKKLYYEKKMLSQYTTKCKYTFKMIQITAKIDEIFRYILNMN